MRWHCLLSIFDHAEQELGPQIKNQIVLGNKGENWIFFYNSRFLQKFPSWAAEAEAGVG
jgi:hypothetical protein